jgi:hypothetical protein
MGEKLTAWLMAERPVHAHLVAANCPLGSQARREQGLAKLAESGWSEVGCLVLARREERAHQHHHDASLHRGERSCILSQMPDRSMSMRDPSVTPAPHIVLLSIGTQANFARAGGGNRTPDIQLGKLTFYL